MVDSETKYNSLVGEETDKLFHKFFAFPNKMKPPKAVESRKANLRRKETERLFRI